jgi:PncC family amidohydrolase
MSEQKDVADAQQAVASVVEEITALCAARGLTVSAVESLTSGAVASALGRGEGASEWFRGAVVAYQTGTKESVLDLEPGTDPCSPSCAEQLAVAGRTLLGADVCVSATGVGGPDPDDGHPAGEVHIGVASARRVDTSAHLFDGDPAEVVERSVLTAVVALRDALSELSEPGGTDVVRLRRIRPSDAGDVLTIQRAAFVSEAQIYGDPGTGPLTQTLAELEAELSAGAGWVAVRRGRLVGALRYREDGDLLLIGRIAIAPDMQGEGLGRRLLAAAEQNSPAREAELFTGSHSDANRRLYEECGYVESERIEHGDGTAQIFLRKRLRD